jgi:hypothetical protein
MNSHITNSQVEESQAHSAKTKASRSALRNVPELKPVTKPKKAKAYDEKQEGIDTAEEEEDHSLGPINSNLEHEETFLQEPNNRLETLEDISEADGIRNIIKAGKNLSSGDENSFLESARTVKEPEVGSSRWLDEKLKKK